MNVPCEPVGEVWPLSFGTGEAGEWGRPWSEFPVARVEVGRCGLRVVVTRERQEQLEAALARAFACERVPGPGLPVSAVSMAASMGPVEWPPGSGLRFAGMVQAVSELV